MSATTLASRRSALWALLLAVTGIAILIGLGTWQLQRRTWKLALIERIAARAHAEPVGIEDALRHWQAEGEAEYLRVTVTGRFEGADAFYFTTGRTGPGYHVYTPLRLADGRLILVNRGYIAAADLPRAPGAGVPRAAGAVTITGLIRGPEASGWFTGAPPPPGASGPWLTRDLHGMAERMLGNAIVSPKQVVPFFLEAERDPQAPAGSPEGGVTRLVLPNRHLEYALTWYGLAGALAAVAFAFLRTARKRE
jgi:surfeit locus 1 family protein